MLTPLFDNRINGTGYIVGIGDSGVDVGMTIISCCFFNSLCALNVWADSCFFADPVQPNPPFNSENPTAEVHRKIVQYTNRNGGDLTDGTGHGTYVVCRLERERECVREESWLTCASGWCGAG